MSISAKQFLPVLLCVALAGIGWRLHSAGYASGHKAAKADGETALATERKARADERQQLAEAGQQALLQVRNDEQQQRMRADDLALQLADREHALEQTRTLLRLNISKAVSDDNQDSDCGYNGLGPHSLQLYSQTLGYTRDGDPRAGDRSGE